MWSVINDMGRLGQVIYLLNFKIKTVNRSLRQEDCFLSITLKDQFTVLILKLGIPNFTDSGLLNMTKDPSPTDPHWFVVVVLRSQVFLISVLIE